MSNKNRTVLYVGATEKLKLRVEKHMKGIASKFTKRYSVNELIYFEVLAEYDNAFLREKQLKNWRKEWKWKLVKSMNPDLKNLYLDL